MRIVKYRGSIHGTNEYPFLIDEEGITVFPVTSLKLDKDVSTKRISSGVSSLDKMFAGKGFFKGSSILVSGHQAQVKQVSLLILLMQHAKEKRNVFSLLSKNLRNRSSGI
jgi:RecA-superfamily ATPases implicated in signal transduction